MTTYTQSGQLGLFLPTDYRPTPHTGAPCPAAIRDKLRRLRDEFAQRAAAAQARAARGAMRY